MGSYFRSKKAVRGFFVQQRGAITIEFALITVALISVLYIAADFGLAITKQGRLDRTAQSLSTVFRERSEFYTGSGALVRPESISQDQIDRLAQLGRALLNDPRLELQVDALYLTADAAEPDNIVKAAVNTLSFCSDSNCSSSVLNQLNTRLPPAALTAFSPYSPGTKRWVPIYRITLAIPGDASLFNRLSGMVVDKPVLAEITASNIVVSRCNLVGSCPGIWNANEW